MSATPEASIAHSIRTLKGVGPRLCEKLARLGIYTLTDLLFHLPSRYQNRSRIIAISDLQPGIEAVVEANVVGAQIIKRGERPTLICRLYDGSGTLIVRFFHFGSAQQALLGQLGARLRCYGEVRPSTHCLEMIHPDWRRVDNGLPIDVERYFTPIYPTTEGLNQATLRTLTEQALHWLHDPNCPLYADLIPTAILKSLGLPSLREALWLIHRPPLDCPLEQLIAGLHPAVQRLAFEELLAHQLSLRQRRARIQQHQAARLVETHPVRSLVQPFLEYLPFRLTRAQQRVVHDIEADLARPQPMLRLVQGDVGSGKTVVAAVAALRAVEAGFQAAVMAPTELLAEQHYHTFHQWFEPLGIQVEWLAGRLKGKVREAALQRIHNGLSHIVVGTHALFQAQVTFADLALVIIDEQHRFGVHQRLALLEKGRQGHYCPHQLIMTATPIPRTLRMSLYADLDSSVIDELPPGRSPVQTVVVSASRRTEVIERIRVACRSGRQAYWVCPLIEESESLECQAAAETAERLRNALPELRIGLVHGRLKTVDKLAVMNAFKRGEIDLLVATTVIEVGVDVPNASLMVIENAERLGLAQMHQLRGRVGRGNQQSSCVLMYQGSLSEIAKARLAVLRESQDGFLIARRDLELRGPGEILGTRQTGTLQLRVADLVRDEHLITKAQHAADELLRNWPQQAELLIQRWIGERDQYGVV